MAAATRSESSAPLTREIGPESSGACGQRIARPELIQPYGLEARRPVLAVNGGRSQERGSARVRRQYQSYLSGAISNTAPSSILHLNLQRR